MDSDKHSTSKVSSRDDDAIIVSSSDHDGSIANNDIRSSETTDHNTADVNDAGGNVTYSYEKKIRRSSSRGGDQQTYNGLEVVTDAKVPSREEITESTEKENNKLYHDRQVQSTWINEKFEFFDVEVPETQVVKKPIADVLHRKLEIETPVYEVQTTEVPQTHIVDIIKEEYTDIKRTRKVDVPFPIIQERVVPLPKRQVEHKTYVVDENKYNHLLKSHLRDDLTDFVSGLPSSLYEQAKEESRKMKTNRSGNILIRRNNDHRQSRPGKILEYHRQSSAKDDVANQSQVTSADEEPTVEDRKEIGIYNSIKQLFKKEQTDENMIKYRHIPQPIEVPAVFYKNNPIERVVNRHVPVPVKISLTQELKCPTLVPAWEETPVPIYYTRTIEKPVPADAFTNKTLMQLYLQQTTDLDRECEKRWRHNRTTLHKRNYPTIEKMTPEEIDAYGLNFDVAFNGKRVDSSDANFDNLRNGQYERHFISKQHL